MDFKKENQEKYNNLRKQFHSLRDQKEYIAAQKTISAIITLIDSNPSSFNEDDDLVNIWHSQNAMLSYQELRNGSSQDAIKFLKEAAEYSTPSVCKHEPCAFLNDDLCIGRQPLLSMTQKKMCIAKNNHKATALKIEGAIAAKRFDYQAALQKRREAARFGEVIWNLEKTPQSQENRDYLDYWLSVTEGYVSLQNGDFQSAKVSFKKSIELGKRLSNKHCFPNYFQNIKEIESHSIYIDGVQSFKDKEFNSAQSYFESWLNLNSEHRGKFYLRYDSMLIFAKISGFLERVAKYKEVSNSEWDEIDDLFENGYIARTTWALKIYLDDVRNLANLVKRGHANKDSIDKIINDIAGRWNLLIPDAILLGEDRIAGFLNRQVPIPSFLDIFDNISESTSNWKEILFQNFKNVLLIMADYEFFRYLDPPQEEMGLPKNLHLIRPSESLSIPELITFISSCVEHRSLKHKRMLDDRMLLQNSRRLIDQNDFRAAVSELYKIIDSIPFKPHVIKVLSQKKIPHILLSGYDTEDSLVNETVALRMSHQHPDEIVFEGNQDLKAGSFYYLRPRWNVRSYDRYRIRHEKFYNSEIPKLVNIFRENLFENKKVAPERFRSWLFQFEDTERLRACKLFSMLDIYDGDAVRQMWLDLFRKELPPETKLKNVIYAGLGHTAKSSANCLYYFRQAIATIESNERSFTDADAFKELTDFSLSAKKPDSVIFIDDLIGSGNQAIKYLLMAFEQHKWLQDKRVYYCALFGYEQGIQEIKNRLSNKLQEVYVNKRLSEIDKAFSSQNPMWENDLDRTNAEQWAAKIGFDVLGEGYDREHHNLGWNNSQALIAFSNNVPNNTLPLFWGTGIRNGKLWKPLLDRHE